MAATILPTYQPFAGLTTQRLNCPLATVWLVVHVTGRLAPCAWLVVPVGAVTLMESGAPGGTSARVAAALMRP